MTTEAVSGVPIAPASISRRMVCSPGPRNVSGAQPSRRPAASACAISASADARSSAIGFSFNTCLPAASAAEATSAWAAGTVRLTISSTSSRASACSVVPGSGTPMALGLRPREMREQIGDEAHVEIGVREPCWRGTAR